MLPWLDVPVLERSPLQSHCEVISEIDLPMIDATVRAGELTDPGVPVDGQTVRFILIRMRGEWLSKVHIHEGDILFVDTGPISYLSPEKMNRSIIYVRSGMGDHVGRYRCSDRYSWLDILDGSGAKMILTDYHHILGVVSFARSTPHWGYNGEYGPGMTFGLNR